MSKTTQYQAGGVGGYAGIRLDASPEEIAANLPPELRADTANTGFLPRELLGLIEGVFETKRPPLNAERLIPSNSNLDPWIDRTTYRQSDSALVYAETHGAGQDLPRVNPKIAEAVSQPCVEYGAMATWTTRELQASQAMGRPLDSQGLSDLRLGWETKRNNDAFYGHNPTERQGLLTLANLERLQSVDSTGAALQINAAADPDEVVQMVAGLIHSVADNSNDSIRANVCMIASSVYREMEVLRIQDRDRTVLEHLRIIMPGVMFEEVRELNNVDTNSGGLVTTPADAPTDHWMVALSNEPGIIQQQIPMPFMVEPELYRIGPREWALIGVFRIGGMHNPYPGGLAARYGC